MRRPVVFLSFAFGMGIITAFLLGVNILVLLLFVTMSLIFVIYSYLFKTDSFLRAFMLTICFFMLGGLWFSINEFQGIPEILESGKNINIKGIVTEADIGEDVCSIVLKSNSGRVLVRYYGESETLRHCIGKSAEVSGVVELPQKQRNPRCFDYSLYLKSCDIQAIVNADEFRIVTGKEIPYLTWSGNLKSAFNDKLKLYTNDFKRGLIMAIIFGEKAGLDDQLYENFQKNGTAHILAVSGLHIGIIYTFFVFLWRWKRGCLFYVSVGTVMLFYMSLADFSPSVVRAGSMIFLHLLAILLKCRYDLLTSAALVFFVMLINNPYQIFHTGFQMSFLAVASLAVIIPFVKRYYQGIFLSAIAIQAGMVPYTAFVFNYISLGSIVANIPVIFIAGILLPIGVVSLLIMTFSDYGFAFLIHIIDLCCETMVWLNDFFYQSGRTSFDVISPPVWSLIIYYGVIFGTLSETGQLLFVRRETYKIVKNIAGICIAAIISIPVMAQPFDQAGIIFVDVGQGDCIHIRTDSGKNYLIDGGGNLDYDVGKKILKPYLLKNGVKQIDTAFVTHLHEDHYGGIRSLAAEGMVKMIGLYEANREMEAKLKRETGVTDFMYLYKGCCIKLDDGVFIEIVSPQPEAEVIYRDMIQNESDENGMSLIMKVNYKGKTVLITGDIDEEGETMLIKDADAELSCDIIKVPHHGSKYSSSEDFIDAVNPVMAVFQVGRNNYGHPSTEVINRYQKKGCAVVRNDRDGAIGIRINDSKSFQVIKMCN